MLFHSITNLLVKRDLAVRGTAKNRQIKSYEGKKNIKIWAVLITNIYLKVNFCLIGLLVSGEKLVEILIKIHGFFKRR